MREGENDMLKFYKSVLLILAITVLSLPALAQSVTADFTYNQNCKAFDFFDNSTPVGGTIVQWDWDFGDGSRYFHFIKIHPIPILKQVILW